jgi:hypothetical protein
LIASIGGADSDRLLPVVGPELLQHRNRTSMSCRNGMFSQRLIAPRLTIDACSRSKNGFGKM